MKKILIGLLAAVVISAIPATSAFADTENSSGRFGFWDNMTQIFNKSKEELSSLLENKTPLQVAEEQGMTKDEFHGKVRQLRQERLQSKVAAGYLTQEQANARMQQSEERMKNCDGTGTHRQGQGGFGNKDGRGMRGMRGMR